MSHFVRHVGARFIILFFYRRDLVLNLKKNVILDMKIRHILYLCFFIVTFSCKKKEINQNSNKLPKKIIYYNLDNDNTTPDSLIIFLFKVDTKPYFDSVIRIETNGDKNVIRFNYSKYATKQIIFKEMPADSTQNVWVMKFQNNTFDSEYLFYNIFNDTYTDDLINGYRLNDFQFFSSFSSTSAGSSSGLNFYCQYEPDSINATKMSFYTSNASPIEKKYECTYTSINNNTQCPSLSGIPANEWCMYPYPNLNMKLVDECWYWNSFMDELSGTYEKYHYELDSKNRVVSCYFDLFSKDPITLLDSLIESNRKVCRFEY